MRPCRVVEGCVGGPGTGLFCLIVSFLFFLALSLSLSVSRSPRPLFLPETSKKKNKLILPTWLQLNIAKRLIELV